MIGFNARYVRDLVNAFHRSDEIALTMTDEGSPSIWRDGGDAYEWFTLAMIRARQGDLDRARTLHQDAVRWTKRFRYGDFELHFLDDEAKALLGPS